MTQGIVERLRLVRGHTYLADAEAMCEEAAAQIEALNAECERAWEAYRIAHNQAMSNGEALQEVRAALAKVHRKEPPNG